MNSLRTSGVEWFASIDDRLSAEMVDGVPFVFTSAPGPVQTGIAFRVGSADERLPQRGFTHLVEHLALHGYTGPSSHRNGMTGTTFTSFVLTGTENQAVDFLNHVCAALRELPVDVLETERSILGVEAQNRAGSMDSNLLQVRFGAQGLGRTPHRELGAETATGEQLRAWVRDWFVAGNAVAWSTGSRVPAGLDLRLPVGSRTDFVHPGSVLATRPAWYSGAQGQILVDAVVPRSAEAAVFTEALSRAVFRRLRVERGLSYTAGAHIEQLDAESARILVIADASAERSEELLIALTGVLESARDGQLDETDVAGARAHLASTRDQVQSSELLGSMVYRYLLGGTNRVPGAEEFTAVADDDIAAVGRAFWDDAIWQTPEYPVPADGVTAIPLGDHAPVEGESYVHETTVEHILVGAEGVSVVSPGNILTVRFAECELVVAYDDGGRVLVGADATWITIEPTMLRFFGPADLASLDAAVPADAVVRLPARPENDIPRPPLTATAARGLGAWSLVVATPMLVLAIIFVITAVTGVSRGSRGGAYVPASGWMLLAVLLVSSALLIGGWIRRIRWRRSQR